MKGLVLLSRMVNKSSCTGDDPGKRFGSGMKPLLAPYANSVGYSLPPLPLKEALRPFGTCALLSK